jgi:selenoprotein W-related protein
LQLLSALCDISHCNRYLCHRQDQIGEVALQPSAVAGTFEVRAEGVTVWNRKTDGGFPEAKVLKQRVRDVISPDKDLGHSESAEQKQ